MQFLYSLLIMVIVLGLLYWIITVLPIPEPFRKIALVIVLVICLLYLLGMMFGAAQPFQIFHTTRP